MKIQTAAVPVVHKVAIYTYGADVTPSAYGSTVHTQSKTIEIFCQQRGLPIVARYVDKKNLKGAADRGSWEQLLKDATSRNFQAVVVMSLCRLGRKQVDLKQRLDALKCAGLDLILTGHGDTYARQNAGIFRAVFSALSRYRAIEQGRHISRAMVENAIGGFFNGGIAPYGFEVISESGWSGRHRKRLSPDPQEASAVRDIYSAFLVGCGTGEPMNVREITEWLNCRGLYRRMGRQWTIRSVRRILQNPIYMGNHHRTVRDRSGLRVVSQVPPIVSPQEFHAAQAKL